MAKPIQATPTLSGKYSDKFIRDMIKKEKEPMTEREKEILDDIKKNKEHFNVAEAGFAHELHDKRFAKGEKSEQ